ncbi:hypothetical protein P153DRAFT_409395 [Dothidotthia symphoricarpi CBS 119687]|uniref:Uncharacterized protein n=1 Tax=Dothidotthia symphoricarpi CBS 119687 TaxID=1392245 RepID=A0A6A6AT42_9PLEO|nr:uncharacterized protein P153DRAFT_409395 [Dothidotthia symphoricarpi CBS 119687]KAF2134017.1 hypothetical protein P153DRAFT_409395 [Dothidotthia symphoricarpi CBS 119687]
MSIPQSTRSGSPHWPIHPCWFTVFFSPTTSTIRPAHQARASSVLPSFQSSAIRLYHAQRHFFASHISMLTTTTTGVETSCWVVRGFTTLGKVIMAPPQSRIYLLGRNKKDNKAARKEEGAKGKKTSATVNHASNLKKASGSRHYEAYYEDVEDEDNTTQETPLFSRKRVPSVEEICNSVRSALHAEIVAADENDSLSSGDDTESSGNQSEPDSYTNESPSASLLIQAPLYVPKRDRLEAVPHTHRRANAAPRSHSDSDDSFLQRIVTLFAGRKVSTKAASIKKCNIPSPIAQSPAPEQNEQTPYATPEQTRTPPPIPRLTHSQAIPAVCSPEVEHLSLYPDYTEILPAPEHPTTGYAVITDDIFIPTVVQRGFKVPKTSPLEPRRKNSAADLLDRDGDVWAQWSSKSSSPETMPFARMQSSGRWPDSRSTSTSEASRVDDEEQARRYNENANHDFDADIGYNYPFAQGRCW